MAIRKRPQSRKPAKTSKPASSTKKKQPRKVAKPVRTRTTHSEALTPRQKEILKLVSQGNTNRDIARRLAISVRTVEVHRFNLMRRLKVRNVAQLLRQALQQGFLPKNFAFR
ncbi:MAG: response regulator transcription factor [Nitrospira sp.]|jgi:DNA-binding NarL/FixJ family response regulator|nr:response regulator transcription factor [Nitrospira sp.]MBP6606535.1 response regulator transcription factor [Nitrospira sp.]MCI1279761.1 response regulator transcription factor [Nitrospira sp.]HQY56792.1 response regulator transcription factor [Nitrospira sp.]HRA96536.1 response regulator transcription factor [Nitrospira sp.]